MASFTFRKQKSVDSVTRYKVTVDNLGQNLPKKTPLTASQIMQLKPSPRFWYPTGTDTQAPRLPGGK